MPLVDCGKARQPRAAVRPSTTLIAIDRPFRSGPTCSQAAPVADVSVPRLPFSQWGDSADVDRTPEDRNRVSGFTPPQC
jgi:hypothetical protein